METVYASLNKVAVSVNNLPEANLAHHQSGASSSNLERVAAFNNVVLHCINGGVEQHSYRTGRMAVWQLGSG